MNKLVTWDLDGVIADSVSVMIQKINEILDAKKITHEPITYDTFSGWGYTKDTIFKYTGDADLAETIDHLFYEPDFLDKSLVFAGVEESISQIAERGYQNEIVSSRPSVCREMTLGWLKRYGLLRFFEKVNIRETDDDGRDFKVNLIEDKQPVLHIDDDPKIVRRTARAWLMDRPWNRNEADLHDRRIAGWQEFVDKMHKVDLAL